jgi:hypothetical protein
MKTTDTIIAFGSIEWDTVIIYISSVVLVFMLLREFFC